METILAFAIIILCCIILSALFSASETAIISISDVRIHKLKSDGDDRASIIEKLRADRENLISTILIANNVSNILASSIATALAIKLFGDEGVIYATILMTISIVVFAEIVPKNYAINNAEKVALSLASFLELNVLLFRPITKFIKSFLKVIFKVFNVAEQSDISALNPVEELRGTIDLHHIEGKVKKYDRDMLDSILDLDEVEVREVMIHRKNITSVSADLDIEEILRIVSESGFARIPVWQDNHENIIGILHIKDLLKHIKSSENIKDVNILDICSKPWFIPDSTNLKKQLSAFREKRSHLAIVVDEYGALQGIITLTDIVEEIVGRIADEHAEINDIKKISSNIYEIEGSVTIRDFNRYVDWKDLSDEDASTVAGYLIHAAERIPEIGEEITLNNIKFTILDKSDNQILRLKLQKIILT